MACLYRMIVFVNVMIFIFSAVVVGISASTIYTWDGSADGLFTKGDFAWFLMSGLLGLIISIFGCLGARNPIGHYNLLFCYFFLLSIALILNLVGFYLYRVFVKNLEASASGDVSSAVRIEAAKEFNDFLLSVYVVCCSGCIQTSVPQCTSTFNATRTSEGYCPTSGAPSENKDCDIPLICDQSQLDVDEGLNQGCFINSVVIPAYEVFNNVCVFFDDFATTGKGRAIVGPVSDQSCGSGNPAFFVKDVFSFMNKNYYLIATFWGFLTAILTLAWLGSLFILTCPTRYEADSKAIV